MKCDRQNYREPPWLDSVSWSIFFFSMTFFFAQFFNVFVSPGRLSMFVTGVWCLFATESFWTDTVWWHLLTVLMFICLSLLSHAILGIFPSSIAVSLWKPVHFCCPSCRRSIYAKFPTSAAWPKRVQRQKATLQVSGSVCICSNQMKPRAKTIERLGESGVTHDSQSASRSGVEARLARNLNGWDDSDAGLSQGWVRCPSGLASLHDSRLSTRSPFQLCSFSSDRRVCHDNHGLFVYDSPNLFGGPSGSVRTGLTGVRSEPGPRTHLTSLIILPWPKKKKTAT